MKKGEKHKRHFSSVIIQSTVSGEHGTLIIFTNTEGNLAYKACVYRDSTSPGKDDYTTYHDVLDSDDLNHDNEEMLGVLREHFLKLNSPIMFAVKKPSTICYSRTQS